MTRRDERRHQRRDVAGAAAEVGDDPVGIEQAEQRLGRRRRRRTARRAGGPTRPPRRRRRPATWRAGHRAREPGAGRPRPPPAPTRPDRARPARALWPSPAATPRPRCTRRLVASRREVTQPPSASVFRWRLTVDCGSRSTSHSSETVSSCVLEHGQDAYANGVREHGELVEDGSGHGVHAGFDRNAYPSSRMKEYTTDRRWSSRALLIYVRSAHSMCAVHPMSPDGSPAARSPRLRRAAGPQ